MILKGGICPITNSTIELAINIAHILRPVKSHILYFSAPVAATSVNLISLYIYSVCIGDHDRNPRVHRVKSLSTFQGQLAYRSEAR